MITLPDYETYRNCFKGRALPLAFVDLDLLEENISQILDRAGDKKIRIASKSVRSLAILKLIQAKSPVFQGVMCLTAPEAVYLSRNGFDDLLLGYPIWQPDQLRAIGQELAQGKTITLMIDSVEHIRHLEHIGAENNVIFPACLDLDLSTDFPGLHFGVWRSGITSAAQALDLWRQIRQSPHVRLDGLMGYEAQLAGVGDKLPGSFLKNNLIGYLKKRSIDEIATRRVKTVNTLRTNGAELRFVNGGGTGSLETTREEEAVTEITVGSGFYSPTLFDHYRNFKHLPAAGFALEIVRQPRHDIYTCSGGGYIASGATGPEKQPQPYLPEGASLFSLEGAGEVQTPVRYRGAQRLNLGDPIFMRHAKAGELCERFNSLLLISKGQVVDEVTTYRGDGHCFL